MWRLRRPLLKYVVYFGFLTTLFFGFCVGKAEPDVQVLVSPSPSASAEAFTFPDLYEASIAELQSGLQSRHFTSVDLVKVSTVHTQP